LLWSFKIEDEGKYNMSMGTTSEYFSWDCCLISCVGRIPVYRVGGMGPDSTLDQHLGTLKVNESFPFTYILKLEPLM